MATHNPLTPTTAAFGDVATQGNSGLPADLKHRHGMMTEASVLDAVFDLFYPVGKISFFAVGTNPGTLYGRGTWVSLGAGKFIVTQDTGDTDFDGLLETGGAKTVTLDTTMIPSHTHTGAAHTHTVGDHTHQQIGDATGSGAITDLVLATDRGGTPQAATNHSGGVTGGAFASGSTTPGAGGSTGGGAAHNNVPPYVVVCAWRRTA